MKSRHLKEYGINGGHEEVGRQISAAQFRGRVLESLRNMEKTQDSLILKHDEHEKEDNKRFKALSDRIWIIIAVLAGAGILGIPQIMGFLG